MSSDYSLFLHAIQCRAVVFVFCPERSKMSFIHVLSDKAGMDDSAPRHNLAWQLVKA